MEGRDTVIYKLSRLLVPVCELDEQGRQAIAGKAQVLRLAPDARIAAADDEAWLTYLVKGELAIRSPDGVLEVVPSGTGRARRPVFNVYPRGVHAEARTRSILLRFDRRLFRCLLSEQQRPRAGLRPLTSQQLFTRVYGAWFEDSLTLPVPVPETHLLYGAGAPRSLRELTAVLRAAPLLSDDFVAATNRVRGSQAALSHPGEAALRLGLAGGRVLALCLAVRRLYSTGGAAAERLAERQFAHGLLIGVLAHLLARRHGGLDPFRALVAGMVHDLGAMLVPLYLGERPETSASDEACSITMRRLRAVVGPALLTRLGFDSGIAQAAEQAEHWHRDEPSVGEADLLVVAHLIAALEEPVPPAPPWPRVPAFARLCPRTSRKDAEEMLRNAIRVCSSIRQRVG
jgi:HD-like signal output (HDOD) protein